MSAMSFSVLAILGASLVVAVVVSIAVAAVGSSRVKRDRDR
jgi:hypothetical protein